MNKMICFSASMADVVFRIECSLESTKWFCRDYLVPDETPAMEYITLGRASISAERTRFLEENSADSDTIASSDESLEFLALCRQVAEILPKYDAVLFHGSCLAMDGEGVLFTAKSGTGKSTHSRLWRQVFGSRVAMINDDKPFLKISSEGVRAYGSPWMGKHRLGCNRSVPLKALCLLERGKKNSVDPAGGKSALPALLQQTYYPETREGVLKTLTLLDRLTQNTQIYRLRCNMDPDAALTAYWTIQKNIREDDTL